MPQSGQFHFQRFLEKIIRNLDKQTSAVARIDICARRPPVKKIAENLYAFFNNSVFPIAIHVENEADTASMVFVLRIVQALSLHISPIVIAKNPSSLPFSV